MEDIERMSYQERSEALNKNVALIARNNGKEKRCFKDCLKQYWNWAKFINKVSMIRKKVNTEYETALSISDHNDFQVYLNRLPNSCFNNKYFVARLLARETN